MDWIEITVEVGAEDIDAAVELIAEKSGRDKIDMLG